MVLTCACCKLRRNQNNAQDISFHSVRFICGGREEENFSLLSADYDYFYYIYI